MGDGKVFFRVESTDHDRVSTPLQRERTSIEKWFEEKTDPERVAVRHEQTAVLRGAIGTLSQKLRTVLVLHDVEGLSQEEVAQMLSIPVGTVKSRVSRARTELRRLLGDQMGDTL